jgi:NitT/TauT family transport system substrate-binding protein
MILGLVVLGLAGCGKQPAEQLRVGTWKTQQTIQPFAYAKFLPAGWRCEVKPFTNPGDMKTAVLAGSLDASGTTLVHAILSGSRGEPVVLVSVLCNKASALVVHAESGITAPAGLRGKRIGCVPSTMHHLLLLDTLRRAGIEAKEVELVRVDFFDMVNALAHRQIDAFLSGEPYPTLAVKNGIGTVLSYPYFDDSIGPINAGMLVRRDFIERKPRAVQALVTAHARATEHYRQDKAAWIGDAAKFGNDPAVLELAAANIELAWDMDARFLEQLGRLGEKMKELGLITQLPDWNTLVATQFVAEARRELAR